MGKKPIHLSNHLYVPERYVTEDLQSKFLYNWVDIEWEEELDEDGNPVLKKNGEVKRKGTKVPKSLTTYTKNFGEEGIQFCFPRGDFGKIKEFTNRYWKKIKDKRIIAPLNFDLRLKKSVRKDDRWKEGQKQCVKEWMENGYGIIKGDTGSGKTVIGTGLICKLKLKTLILTKRRDGNKHWINQIRKLTNIDQLEHQLAERLIGAYNTKQSAVYPITVATVQSFRSKRGLRDLKKFSNKWGLVLADECHELVTHKYRTVPTAINAVAIAGLTATDERDDHLHFIEYDIFGPVVTQNAGRKLDPFVTFIRTGVKAPGWIYQKSMNPGLQWHICMKTLIQSSRRFDIIQKFLMEDVEAGHRVAVISVQRREIIQELAKRMRQAGYKVAYVDGTTKNRDRIYSQFDAGHYDVLCAGKVMNALVDIQSLDCVHMVSPLKSKQATRQVYGRARERNALIRDYIDEGGQLGGAANSRISFCETNGWEIKEIDMSSYNSNEPQAMGIWKGRS